MTTILTTILIITGITTTLAILITFANAFIADYGEKKIVINNDKEFIVEGGKSILGALVDNKIFIPSACGGKGSCGYCKAKVIEGGGPVLATELSYLTEEDQENDIRLTCQVKVKEDMKIEIPDELFNVKQFQGKVVFSKDLTEKIKHLRIKITDGQEIEFKPGQYVQLLAPPYPGNAEEVFRAYSVASSPSQKDQIDLIIGLVEEGLVTTYVHEHLSEGDEVIFNGPFGDFYLNEDSDSDMYMVAIGTGMAPLRSILHYMNENNIERRVRYYFGARKPEDLFMVEEMKKLEEEMYDYEFIPVLSRVEEGDDWDGETGRVTDLVDKYLEAKAERECEAYLCGSAPMIDSTEKALVEKGLKDDKVFYDKFD